MHEREREHIAAYNRAAKQETGSKRIGTHWPLDGAYAMGADIRWSPTRPASEDQPGGATTSLGPWWRLFYRGAPRPSNSLLAQLRISESILPKAIFILGPNSDPSEILAALPENHSIPVSSLQHDCGCSKIRTRNYIYYQAIKGVKKSEAEEDDNSGDEYKNEGDEDKYNSEEKDDTSDESEIEGGEEGCMTHPENKDEDNKKDSEVSYGREEQYTLTPKVDKLAEIIYRLSVFLATKQFTNGQRSSSLLVYYSSVLGCTEDGSTFRRPKDYTPQLSALIYIQRLLLLEFALPCRAYTYVCIPCRPQYDQLGLAPGGKGKNWSVPNKARFGPAGQRQESAHSRLTY
ncbi:hypothetical protein V502_02087 [Pseudogymnoascus sp. VKM F-4520 (FW-2644)]|nr:hypothetical protein V502_02087 [Pseudogymnoascus sp. VKM F-4520 (FW-2644)]